MFDFAAVCDVTVGHGDGGGGVCLLVCLLFSCCLSVCAAGIPCGLHLGVGSHCLSGVALHHGPTADRPGGGARRGHAPQAILNINHSFGRVVEPPCAMHMFSTSRSKIARVLWK